MEYLTDTLIVLKNEDCPNNFNYINFNSVRKHKKINPALKICFSNDIKYNISCLKKLIKFKKNNINFGTKYGGVTVKYVVQNLNEEIFDALKAIELMENEKEQYTYIYDCLCKHLDNIWNEKNPCNFCNNTCIANREKIVPNTENGCCYSFKYAKNFFHLLDENEKDPVCKYIEQGKGCTTKNVSCKIFACNYIKSKYSFKIDTKKLLLFETFFNPKQKLVLKYNFFKSREQLIDKILEKDSSSYLIYRLKMKFIILD